MSRPSAIEPELCAVPELQGLEYCQSSSSSQVPDKKDGVHPDEHRRLVSLHSFLPRPQRHELLRVDVQGCSKGSFHAKSFRRISKGHERN